MVEAVEEILGLMNEENEQKSLLALMSCLGKLINKTIRWPNPLFDFYGF